MSVLNLPACLEVTKIRGCDNIIESRVSVNLQQAESETKRKWIDFMNGTRLQLTKSRDDLDLRSDINGNANYYILNDGIRKIIVDDSFTHSSYKDRGYVALQFAKWILGEYI